MAGRLKAASRLASCGATLRSALRPECDSSPRSIHHRLGGWRQGAPANSARQVAAAAGLPATEISTQAGARLESLPWDHTFVNELPADPVAANYVRQVEGAMFSFVQPTPPAGEPYLITYSPQVARLVGLDPSECERPEFPMLFSGAAPLPGARPYAQCYGGHQFGNWAGQLGDGRAITLGEVVNSAGERWELQLKGAGRTPYSRFADGRAVLRSSLREFVASEAMAALGVPTTRALCLVGTGDQVLRDMFYNGNAKLEPGAVVCRVAPSLVRFGSFQLPVSRGGEGGEEMVRGLMGYVVKHHFKHLIGHPEAPLEVLKEVVARTARLVAAWQSVGFVHGVLNTDNMSILGLTIDYGPFGFMDRFEADYTPNTTDMRAGRRYCYKNQAEAVQFSLIWLANSLLAANLLTKEQAQAVLEQYSVVVSVEYHVRMAAKLGLREFDRALTGELMRLMIDDGADFTNTFRALCSVSSSSSEDEVPEALQAAVLSVPAGSGAVLPEERRAAWGAWLQAYRARLRADGVLDSERQAAQRAACPKFIPRQHLLQYAIEAAEQRDFSELEALLAVLERPYDEQPDADPKYSSPPPEDMAGRPGVCFLSCSS